jgi:Concanavalin A-like lectin/glucanases superfamily
VLPPAYTYHCANATYYRKTDGTGWIPVNLSQNTFGSSLAQLPIDPVNVTSSRLWYTYATDGAGRYEATTAFESAKYKLGGSNDQVSGDGGTLATVYEKGSKLGLEPLDYGDSSLVGLWTFDEGSGSVAYDYSGFNATGSWSGTLGNQWTTGRVGGYAGNFNGSNDYVSVPSQSNLMPSGAFSLSAWVKVSYATTTYFGIVTKYSSCTGGTCGYDLGSYATHQAYFNVRSATNGSSPSAVAPGVSDDGLWHYVVGVFTGSQVIAYSDGVAGTPMSWSYPSAPDPTEPFQIGARGGAQFFPGQMDDVRIYSRALSPAEIQALYNAEK